MSRIKPLPHWCVTDKNPAFYDTESATAIEQTAKLYAKMQEFILDYNTFVDPLNQEIADCIKEIEESFECLKAKLVKIQHDYIMTIDEKIKMQDLVIKKYYEQFDYSLAQYKELVNKHMEEQDEEIKTAVDYMQRNIKETTQEVASDLLQNGKISVNHTYFSIPKKLLLAISNSGIVYDDKNKQLNIITRMEV